MKKIGIETTEDIIISKFGEAKIKELKDKYAPRHLSVIVVEDKVAVLRPIGAAELARFSVLSADSERGLDVASRYLLEELWLEGDNELRDDEEYFMCAMLQLQNTMELKKSSFMSI